MNWIHFCLWVLAGGLSRWASLVGLLEAHGSEVLHAFRTLNLAVAAAPGMVSCLALRVVQKTELLGISTLFTLSCSTPVPRWFHAIVCHVLELFGAN